MKTAQQWLKDEDLENYDTTKKIPPHVDGGPNYITGAAFPLDVIMERFANYRTNEFAAAILDFRNKIVLNGGLSDFTILSKYDEHFGIERHTHGQI